MKKMAHFIVHHRKLISKVYIGLVILSALIFPMVGINYDLTEYLDSTMPSKQAIDIAEQEFGMQGSARIMIKGMSITQAKDIKSRIEQVEGVDMVLWLDSEISDVYAPTSFINQDDIKDYVNGDSILFDVTFIEEDASKLTHNALDEIKKICGEDSYISGPSIENKTMQSSLMKEVAIAMAVAIPIVFLILLLTTTSYYEPVMFLGITAMGIIINLGSNIIFGKISFFTFSVAAILQLAISMDYSIFLLHSFTKQKKMGDKDEELAMEHAIAHSVVSILASGLTTVVGFVALALMQFKIGKDMGYVLAKGIVISLITVIFYMPSSILRHSKQIQNTEHKPFITISNRTSRFIFKAHYVIVPILLLIVYPCYKAQGMNSFLYGNDALGSSKGTQAYEDKMIVEEKFDKSNMMLIMVPRENNIKEKRLAEVLEELPQVRYAKTIASELPDGIPESFLPESTTSKFHSENYTRYLISVYTNGESDAAFDALNKIEYIVNDFYPEGSYVAGVTPSTLDIKKVIESDYKKVNIISIIGIGIIILLTFKCFLAPVILIFVIESGIFINMAITYLSGEKLLFMGYLIVSSIQLGATIDYAILMTENYNRHRKTCYTKEAAINAIHDSALSILTSGCVLTSAAFVIGVVCTVSGIKQLGFLISRGAFLSLILVLSVLPTFLMVFDRGLTLTTFGALRKEKPISKKLAKLKEAKQKNNEDGEESDNADDVCEAECEESTPKQLDIAVSSDEEQIKDIN